METSDQMSGKIYKQMALIMADVEPIAKERENQAQHYKFRGVDDVYQALQAIMAKHGVFALPTVLEDRTEDRQTAKGSALIYRILKIRYDFYAEDGSSVPATVIGEGMDSGDKASNKAMSVAHKYALLQAYCIPTAEPKDPENESPEPLPVKLNKPVLAKDGEVEIYRDSPQQQVRLENLLGAKLNIPKDLWIAISDELMGQPCTQQAVDAAIAHVLAEVSSI